MKRRPAPQVAEEEDVHNRDTAEWPRELIERVCNESIARRSRPDFGTMRMSAYDPETGRSQSGTRPVVSREEAEAFRRAREAERAAAVSVTGAAPSPLAPTIPTPTSSAYGPPMTLPVAPLPVEARPKSRALALRVLLVTLVALAVGLALVIGFVAGRLALHH